MKNGFRWKKNAADRIGMPILGAVLALGTAILLGGCSGKVELQSFDVQYLEYFDTFSSITIYAEDEKQFQEYAQIVKEGLEHYHQLYDIYHNYEGINNIKTINDNAGIAPVEVDADILALLAFAGEEYENTDGKVNVAMGSVLSIWHDYREEALASPEMARIPDGAELLKAAEHTDFEQIQIDESASTVYLPDSQMRLDVGAVAKGYATERIAEDLRKAGVTSALLSLGGNVETIGERGDGKPWRVGVQNPDMSGNRPYLYALDLTDMALVTSGTYQRYYEVEGVRYHHIINPDTWMPWQEYASVTILCKDSGVADALSTAVFNMALAEGQAYVESLADTEALWVLPDGSEVMSSGFSDYIDKQ